MLVIRNTYCRKNKKMLERKEIYCTHLAVTTVRKIKNMGLT